MGWGWGGVRWGEGEESGSFVQVLKIQYLECHDWIQGWK